MSELEAGRELDALVAEKVMGWTDVRDFGPDEDGRPFWRGEPSSENHLSVYQSANYKCYGWAPLPYYSTDIASAWMVVEKMRERRIGEDGMRAVLSIAHYYTSAEVATAICRAALKAVEGQV